MPTLVMINLVYIIEGISGNKEQMEGFVVHRVCIAVEEGGQQGFLSSIAGGKPF